MDNKIYNISLITSCNIPGVPQSESIEIAHCKLRLQLT